MTTRPELRSQFKKISSRLDELESHRSVMEVPLIELRKAHRGAEKRLKKSAKGVASAERKSQLLSDDLQRRERIPDASSRLDGSIVRAGLVGVLVFGIVGWIFGPIVGLVAACLLLLPAIIGAAMQENRSDSDVVAELRLVEKSLIELRQTAAEHQSALDPISEELRCKEAEYSQLIGRIDKLSWRRDDIRSEIDVIDKGLRWSVVRIDSSDKLTTDAVHRLGKGGEWIYAYTFPAYRREEGAYPIKVGMTTVANPLDRITQQLGTSNPEPATVVLLIRCDNSRAFESWLHDRLSPSIGRVGKEWFDTTIPELKRLAESYVERHARR